MLVFTYLFDHYIIKKRGVDAETRACLREKILSLQLGFVGIRV